MLKISPEKIKEIAEQLDIGMKVFYHLCTGELVIYPDELRWGGEADEEFWGEEIAKIEGSFHEYFTFTGMESHESFRLIEDFIETIADKDVREKFEDIIQQKSPFQRFKYSLFDYPLLRERWFLYKDERYIEYVQEQVDDYNRSEKFKDIS